MQNVKIKMQNDNVKFKNKFSKGSVLVFSMIMLSMILMSALAIGAATVIERKNSITSSKSTQGFQVADSGIEIVAKKIRETAATKTLNDVSLWPSCSSGSITDTTSLGADKPITISFFTDANATTLASCTVNTAGDIKSLKAVGTYSTTTRAVDTPIRNHEAAILSDSIPISYWKMNSDVTDAKGANNAIATNLSYLSTSGNFKFGSAAGDFNGSTSSVSVNNSASLNGMSELSIEMWVKFDSLASTYMLLRKDQAYRFYVDNNGAVQFDIGVVGSTWLSTAGTIASAGTGTLQTGKWYQIVGVYEGSGKYVKLYINGALVATGSATVSGNIVTNANIVSVGSNGAAGNYLDGQIDEFAIYNRALSQSEIMSHR
jgi:hypothetical protein